MIVVASGISASGKTTWVNARAQGCVVPEHGALPDAPHADAPGDQQAAYWTTRNCERWAAALEGEAAHGLALCDSDPLKLHYSYALWRMGLGERAVFDAMASASRAAIAEGRLGFADCYHVSPLSADEARRNRAADPTRTRRNFERHALLHAPLMEWYYVLGILLPGRVVFDLPAIWKPPEVGKNPRRHDPLLLDELLKALGA